MGQKPRSKAKLRVMVQARPLPGNNGVAHPYAAWWPKEWVTLDDSGGWTLGDDLSFAVPERLVEDLVEDWCEENPGLWAIRRVHLS